MNLIPMLQAASAARSVKRAFIRERSPLTEPDHLLHSQAALDRWEQADSAYRRASEDVMDELLSDVEHNEDWSVVRWWSPTKLETALISNALERYRVLRDHYMYRLGRHERPDLDMEGVLNQAVLLGLFELGLHAESGLGVQATNKLRAAQAEYQRFMENEFLPYQESWHARSTLDL